jgi:hypothetical protein
MNKDLRNIVQKKMFTKEKISIIQKKIEKIRAINALKNGLGSI